MKKIDLKNIFYIVFLLTVVCLLKKLCLPLDYEMNYTKFASFSLILWNESPFLNILWLFPFIISIIFVAKKYYSQLFYFDVRFKSRKNYINRTIFKTVISLIFYNLFITFFQLFLLSILNERSILISLDVFYICLQYVIEVVCLEFIIIFLGYYTKKFMYSFVIIILIMILLLTLIFNFNFIESISYFPFISMYSGFNINYVSIIISVIILFLIRKKYISSDILGGNDI